MIFRHPVASRGASFCSPLLYQRSDLRKLAHLIQEIVRSGLAATNFDGRDGVIGEHDDERRTRRAKSVSCVANGIHATALLELDINDQHVKSLRIHGGLSITGRINNGCDSNPACQFQVRLQARLQQGRILNQQNLRFKGRDRRGLSGDIIHIIQSVRLRDTTLLLMAIGSLSKDHGLWQGWLLPRLAG